MKLLDITPNCYAHLIENAAYIYVDNCFTEILYVDDIENAEDPIPLILHEMELASRPSLSKLFQFF